MRLLLLAVALGLTAGTATSVSAGPADAALRLLLQSSRGASRGLSYSDEAWRAGQAAMIDDLLRSSRAPSINTGVDELMGQSGHRGNALTHGRILDSHLPVLAPNSLLLPASDVVEFAALQARLDPARIDAAFRAQTDPAALVRQGFRPDVAREIAEISLRHRGLQRWLTNDLLSELGTAERAFQGGLERALQKAAKTPAPPATFTVDITTGKVIVNATHRIGEVEIAAPSFNIYKVAAVGLGFGLCIGDDSCREMFSESPVAAVQRKLRAFKNNIAEDVWQRVRIELSEPTANEARSRLSFAPGTPDASVVAPEWLLIDDITGAAQPPALSLPD